MGDEENDCLGTPSSDLTKISGHSPLSNPQQIEMEKKNNAKHKFSITVTKDDGLNDEQIPIRIRSATFNASKTSHSQKCNNIINILSDQRPNINALQKTQSHNFVPNKIKTDHELNQKRKHFSPYQHIQSQPYSMGLVMKSCGHIPANHHTSRRYKMSTIDISENSGNSEGLDMHSFRSTNIRKRSKAFERLGISKNAGSRTPSNLNQKNSFNPNKNQNLSLRLGLTAYSSSSVSNKYKKGKMANIRKRGLSLKAIRTKLSRSKSRSSNHDKLNVLKESKSNGHTPQSMNSVDPNKYNKWYPVKTQKKKKKEKNLTLTISNKDKNISFSKTLTQSELRDIVYEENDIILMEAIQRQLAGHKYDVSLTPNAKWDRSECDAIIGRK